jgi:hypothetical protein
VAGEREAPDPLAGRLGGDRPLRGVARAGQDLLVHVGLAGLAQRLEGGRVAAAFRQAVPAVAESVRGAGEAAILQVAVKREARRR